MGKYRYVKLNRCKYIYMRLNMDKMRTLLNFNLVNFLCELGQIMTIYDFLYTIQVILSNVRADLNLT